MIVARDTRRGDHDRGRADRRFREQERVERPLHDAGCRLHDVRWGRNYGQDRAHEAGNCLARVLAGRVLGNGREYALEGQQRPGSRKAGNDLGLEHRDPRKLCLAVDHDRREVVHVPGSRAFGSVPVRPGELHHAPVEEGTFGRQTEAEAGRLDCEVPPLQAVEPVVPREVGQIFILRNRR
ncbi:MAG: hypothetical protein RBG13Loki_1849 [Promethearchaeota archaeon CR_4]|nr:MAG: hypothetical protein RBG13Loki_1849 [Candidatus Lokiarchaeota archaeon CR_4]